MSDSGTIYSGLAGRIEPVPVDAAHPLAPPGWLRSLPQSVAAMDPSWFSRFLPPDEGGRQSAVLILFGPPPAGAERDGVHLLLCERSHTMRSHAGQIAFPGGAAECDDEHLVETALREAWEETGLDPAGVTPIASLPNLFLPPSGFVVHPVVAWWSRPSPVRVAEPNEANDVLYVPVSHLVDPAHRFTVTHPSGYRGPAFEIDHLLLWGFTAGLTGKVLELAGQSRPWDEAVERPLPDRFLGGGR